MKSKKYLLTFGLVLSSIVSTYFVTVSTAQQSKPDPVNNDYQIGATLFMQKAAEYRGLCYQAFYWARRTLDDDEKTSKKLPKAERKMPRAVVVDIDETVLDNSPAQAYGIKNHSPYNSTDWNAWVNMRKAKAIPGAVEFAAYAKSKNVRIFYVSNRDEVLKASTIANLKAVGFPDVTEENVLLKQSESTKEPRRKSVAAKYRIVILMGDNLNDLSAAYESTQSAPKSVADRFAAVEADKALYGNRFIVLPNAIYGEWETTIYRDDKTGKDNDTKRLNALELP